MLLRRLEGPACELIATGRTNDEIEYLGESFNRMIEAQVRLAPEQYLWIHRRFKGLTENYPDYYAAEAPRRA